MPLISVTLCSQNERACEVPTWRALHPCAWDSPGRRHRGRLQASRPGASMSKRHRSCKIADTTRRCSRDSRTAHLSVPTPRSNLDSCSSSARHRPIRMPDTSLIHPNGTAHIDESSEKDNKRLDVASTPLNEAGLKLRDQSH